VRLRPPLGDRPPRYRSVVPILLGSGERLFDNVGDDPPELERVDSVEAPGVTHVRYRVVKTA
jgi:dihydrofolate reductase